MRPVLIVGQAPSRRHGRDRAFAGSASGARLERLLGLQPGELTSVADTVNVLPEWPGEARPGSSGDRFDRRRASRIDVSGRGLVVLCGAGVAAAMGLPRMRFFEAAVVDGATVVLVPHPSGASRWWNDPARARAAARFMSTLIPGARRLLA